MYATSLKPTENIRFGKKVLDCPANNTESPSETHSENNNDKQPDSPKGGEMELERQTSEQGNDNFEIDHQTDEYDTDSDSELLLRPVSNHEDETVFLHAVTTRSGRTVKVTSTLF